MVVVGLVVEAAAVVSFLALLTRAQATLTLVSDGGIERERERVREGTQARRAKTEEHQSGDYLCTITITGNVVLAEQLIHERLAEQYQPRRIAFWGCYLVFRWLAIFLSFVLPCATGGLPGRSDGLSCLQGWMGFKDRRCCLRLSACASCQVKMLCSLLWSSQDPTVVGQVIGPGGANLRHIFDTTGCKIKFIQVRSSSQGLRSSSSS